jgi:hypothetical protein
MIVCYDPAIEPVDDDNDVDDWVGEMGGRGVRLEGSPLYPDDATTVRVRGGEVLVSDGPFAETKEVMVGYDFLECAPAARAAGAKNLRTFRHASTGFPGPSVAS